MSPLDRCLYFSSGSGEEDIGKESCWYSFCLTSTQLCCPLGTGPLQGMGAGGFLPRETITVFDLYVTIPKGSMGQAVPSVHLAKLGANNERC